MSDSESEGGGGASSSYPGIRIPDRGPVPREHSPLPGSWRKEKQFPGAGSDRNTTPPGAPEPGPESKRTRLLPGSAWALRIRPPSCQHTQELTVQGEGGTPPHPTHHNYLHTQATPRASRKGHLTLGTKQTKAIVGGGRGWGLGEETISGASEVTPIPLSQCPSPHPKLGRGHLQQPPSNSKNLKHVSFNLRAPDLGGQVSFPPRPEGALKNYFLGEGEGASEHCPPPPPMGLGWRNSLGSPEADRKPGHTPPPPLPLKVIRGGRGQFLRLGLQGLALGRCQMLAGYVRPSLLQQGNCT